MSSQTETKCGWSGKLPEFQKPEQCIACHKLRSAGDVVRCRMSGPRIEGLGDVIATVTRATGIAQAVEYVTGGDCGCPGRQAMLNKLVPIGTKTTDPSPAAER